MIGARFLLCSPPEGKTGCFPLKKVRPICFCGSSLCSCPLFSVPFLSPAVGGRKSNIVVIGQLTNTSLRLRRKTDTKQKQIASGRRRCAGASGLFIRFRKLQKHPHHFFIFNSERIAARAPRITTSVKQERLKRTVFPKRVNGSQGQYPPVPCGSEGKPDFPLQVRPNSFLYASQ